MSFLTVPRAVLITSGLLVLAPLVVPGWIVFVMTKGNTDVSGRNPRRIVSGRLDGI